MHHPFMICGGFVRIVTSPEMTSPKVASPEVIRNDVTGSRELETGKEKEDNFPLFFPIPVFPAFFQELL